MASLATLHADQVAFSKRIGGTLRRGGDYGFETNTNVAAADTVAGLRTAVAVVAVHADFEPARARVQNAINRGADSSELTDARILGLTTVEELVGLTYAISPDVSRDLIPT